MRTIRDREERDDTCEAYAWHIAAKLHKSHMGVGSWALFYARCEDHARGIYDELFPGRVIVTVTRSAKGYTLAELRQKGKLGTVEREWAKKKVTKSERTITPEPALMKAMQTLLPLGYDSAPKKRVIRDR